LEEGRRWAVGKELGGFSYYHGGLDEVRIWEEGERKVETVVEVFQWVVEFVVKIEI
jgi:hypothetical protein